MKIMRKALPVILSAVLLLGIAFTTLASAYTPTEDMPNSAANADLMSGDTVIGKSNINRFEDQQVYTTRRLDGYNYTIGRKGTYANGYSATAGKMNTHQTVTEIAADGTANTYLKYHFEEDIPKGGTGNNTDAYATFAAPSTSTIGSTRYYVIDFDLKTSSTFPDLGLYLYSRQSSSNKHYAKIASLSGTTASFTNDGQSATFAADEWHHITAVYQINKDDYGTSEMRVYFDGRYVGNFLGSDAGQNGESGKPLSDSYAGLTLGLYVGYPSQRASAKGTNIGLDNVVASAIPDENENLASLFGDNAITDLKTVDYPEFTYTADYVLPTAMANVEAYTKAEDGTITTYATVAEAVAANPDGEIYLNKNATAALSGSATIYTMGYTLDYTLTGNSNAAPSDNGTAHPQDDFVLLYDLPDSELAIFKYYDSDDNLIATSKIPADSAITHPQIAPSRHNVTFTDEEATAFVETFLSWVAYDENGSLVTVGESVGAENLGKTYTMKGSYGERKTITAAVKTADGTITVYTEDEKTLSAVIAEAPSGSTVKLFANYLATAKMSVGGRDIAIDLNGYAIYTNSKTEIFTSSSTNVFTLYSSRAGGSVYCGYGEGYKYNYSGIILSLSGAPTAAHIGWLDKNGNGSLDENEKTYAGNLTLTGSTIVQHAGTENGLINAYGTTFITSAPDNSAMFMLRGSGKTVYIDSCKLYTAGARDTEEFFGFRDTSGTHSIYVSDSLLVSYATSPADLISHHEATDQSENHVYFTNTSFVNIAPGGDYTDTYYTTVHMGTGCRFSSFVESDYLVFEDADGNALTVARTTPEKAAYTLRFYNYAYYEKQYYTTSNIDTALLYTTALEAETATVTWDFGEGNEDYNKEELWLIGSMPISDDANVMLGDGTLLGFDPVLAVITGDVTFVAVEYATADSLELLHNIVLYESFDYQIYIPTKFTAIKTITVGDRVIDITTLPTVEDGAYYVWTVNKYAAKDLESSFNITFSLETERGTMPSATISFGILSYLEDALASRTVDANTKVLIATILEYAKAASELLKPTASTDGIQALLDYCQRIGVEAYKASTVADPVDEGDLGTAFEYAALNLVSTPQYYFALRETFTGSITVGDITYTVTDGRTEDGKDYILYAPTLAQFNAGVTVEIGETGEGSYSLANYMLSQFDIENYVFPIYAEALYNLSELVAKNFADN